MSNPTPLPFAERLAIGQESEKLFMDKISLAGGTAASLGKVPLHKDETPRFGHPHPTNEKGFFYSVAPDIVVTLPFYPKGVASFVQVKRKTFTTSKSGNRFIYLDEQELHRLYRAADFHDVLFVIHIPETDTSPDEWLWVNAEDLRNERFQLRRLEGKKALSIPLSLFKSFTALVERTPYVPANTNTSTENERPRTQTH